MNTVNTTILDSNSYSIDHFSKTKRALQIASLVCGLIALTLAICSFSHLVNLSPIGNNHAEIFLGIGILLLILPCALKFCKKKQNFSKESQFSDKGVISEPNPNIVFSDTKKSPLIHPPSPPLLSPIKIASSSDSASLAILSAQPPTMSSALAIEPVTQISGLDLASDAHVSLPMTQPVVPSSDSMSRTLAIESAIQAPRLEVVSDAQVSLPRTPPVPSHSVSEYLRTELISTVPRIESTYAAAVSSAVLPQLRDSHQHKRKVRILELAYDQFDALYPAALKAHSIVHDEKIMAEVRKRLEQNLTDLRQGKHVLVGTFFHATKVRYINDIIRSGQVTKSEAVYGIGAYVSTVDEYDIYGDDRGAEPKNGGYTIVFDSTVIEDMIGSVIPKGRKKVWFQMGKHIPVNRHTVAYITMDPDRIASTGHTMIRRFNDGADIPIINRDVSQIMAFILNAVTLKRYLSPLWTRYAGEHADDTIDFPENAAHFAEAPAGDRAGYALDP